MPVAYEDSAFGPTQTKPPVFPHARTFLMINSFETGGTERQLIMLSQALQREGLPTQIGCLQTKGPLRDLVGDVHKFELGGSLYGVRSWNSRRQLARHLRQAQIQIAHAFDFYTNLTLIPAARWAKTPVVIGSFRQVGDLLTPRQFRVLMFFFKRCDVVVCNSQAAAATLRDGDFPESKIRVIGNALDPKCFEETAPLMPQQHGLLRVGMIARMNDRYKNHLVFLRAAAAVLNNYHGVEFVLAGDGPLRAEFEAECNQLGIRDQVHFLGDQRNVPAVLASLDISVVPSDSESLSNVILESMAAAVPVLATDVGGNPELVREDRGILVRCRDVDALVHGILQLLRNTAYRESIGQNARKFAREHFSEKYISAQYQELYSQLLSGKSRERAFTKKAQTECVRVAIIAPSLRYVGGQAVQADLLLQHWKGDLDARTAFVPTDPPFPAGFRWVRSIPLLRTVIRSPFYWMSLQRCLRQVDVAHIFSASHWSFLLAPVPAWLIAWANGKKALINYRSGEACLHLRKSRVARAVLRRADRLVVPSGYLVDVFREFGINAEVIPNIVDTSQFRFRVRSRLRPHLVCTRGFHPYYCIDVVVKAFAEVKKHYPDAQLDLVGGGTLEDNIRRLVAELKLAGVNFCGIASRRDIATYYDRADIFINASCVDNMPVSVLEAFASGTPVVTTSPESMRYLIEDERTGLLSPPGDAVALANNVIRILRDSELAQRLILNARAESERYHWKSVRQQWLRIYRDLARPAINR